MKCKLCLKDTNLIGKSHIIPNFMYAELYDEKHRLLEIEAVNGDFRNKWKQSGAYEGGILCETCDNEAIGHLEDYVKRVLYGGNLGISRKLIKCKETSYTLFTELNYPIFKLFLLSILWRASISSLPIFEEVNLGPHEETIRQMILQRDPREPNVYPCLMFTDLDQITFPEQWVLKPRLRRIKGGYAYILLIGRVLYTFFISKHIFSPEFLDYTINRKGELRVIHLSRLTAEDIFKDLLR